MSLVALAMFALLLPEQALGLPMQGKLNQNFQKQNNEDSYTKLFVAIGIQGTSNDENAEFLSDVEVVDLIELDHPCPKPASFPVAMSGAVGTFVDGAPTICGGTYNDGKDRCYRYNITKNTWERQDYAMETMRVGAAGAMTNDAKSWVISGGSDDHKSLDTSEKLINNSDFILSFNLPMRVTNHALLSLDDDVFMTVGGLIEEDDNSGTNTWLYNNLGGGDFWSPQMPTFYPHESIMAGVTTALDGRKEVVVTGGDPYVTEIFSLNSLTWRFGPDAPNNIIEGAFVQYFNSFITVGGWDTSTGRGEEKIYLYDPDNEVWIHFSQTLATPRSNPVAFMVPDDFCPGGHDP